MISTRKLIFRAFLSSPELISGSPVTGDSDLKDREPWVDTPDVPHLSITDSDECDTDLEIDIENFGKGTFLT